MPQTTEIQIGANAWQTAEDGGSRGPSVPRWHVLWTRSNCEQMVYERLTGKGFHLFLPKMEVWSRRGGIRRRSRAPMFPGYVFLRHAMHKVSYIDVCGTRGLVRLLGERWDQLAVVPDREMDAILRVERAHLPALPHPYLREGQRVRITSGLLADVEGILVGSNPRKGQLVISIDMLQRSVAVEVDCTLVVAA